MSRISIEKAKSQTGPNVIPGSTLYHVWINSYGPTLIRHSLQSTECLVCKTEKLCIHLRHFGRYLERQATKSAPFVKNGLLANHAHLTEGESK